MTSGTAELAARVAEILHVHAGAEGPLLPVLHDLQAAFGHIPDAALPLVAEGLNLSRAEVHGVVSFYHDFRDAPAGRHVLKLCRAEACQSMGGDGVAAQAMGALGIGWHQTTPDGAITLEPVFCLGLCACAPAAMVDGRGVGRVDEARVGALIAGLRA